jgi:Sulfotransferase family
MSMLGHVDRCTRNFILGWAADPAAPSKTIEICIVLNGLRIGRTRAELPRAPLQNAFPGSTGRYGFRYEFDPPLSPFRDQKIDILFCDNEQSVPNGKRFIRKLNFTGNVDDLLAHNSGPTPLLVTSAGRSGSSLCMARLAAHPQIAVGGDHPFEVLLLSYYSVALRTMTADADRARSLSPEMILAAQSKFRLGFNPFNDTVFGDHESLLSYWSETSPTVLARSFRSLIWLYYESVCNVKQKRLLSFFCEKSQANPVVRQGTMAMFGRLKEIILLRDPRDLLCSAKSFWHLETDRAIQNIKSQYNYLLTREQHFQTDTIFVRYEDLILEPEKTMRAIYAFLGVEYSDVWACGDRGDVFAQHATSRSPVDSIGRWRNDLSSDEVALCVSAFDRFLAGFKYPA